MAWIDTLLALAGLLLALALRPWRALAGTTLPWPALAVWALLPLLWSLDVVTQQPLLQPLSGVCLLLLMLGWPLTVLMLVPVTAVMALIRHAGGHLRGLQARLAGHLHRPAVPAARLTGGARTQPTDKRRLQPPLLRATGGASATTRPSTRLSGSGLCSKKPWA